jgi:HPt (histidine-containing phosphotransfer) domain-containing protein
VFRDDAARLLADLRAASDQGNPRTVHMAAHTLKGMVSFFAAHEATAVALEIEKRAEQGDLTDSAELSARLAREVEWVETALARLLSRRNDESPDCRG